MALPPSPGVMVAIWIDAPRSARCARVPAQRNSASSGCAKSASTRRADMDLRQFPGVGRIEMRANYDAGLIAAFKSILPHANSITPAPFLLVRVMLTVSAEALAFSTVIGVSAILAPESY